MLRQEDINIMDVRERNHADLITKLYNMLVTVMIDAALLENIVQ